MGTFLNSCSLIYGTCEDEEDIKTKLIAISDVKHVSSPNRVEVNSSSNISRRQYGGFRIECDTEILSFYKPNFSLVSSAYALDCNEADIVLRDTYPISARVITLYDLDDNTKAGDLANQYFILPFRTTDENRTIFDIEDVKKTPFDPYYHEPTFYLEFRIHTTLTPHSERNIQFRVEMEMNNGEFWIEETPLLITRY